MGMSEKTKYPLKVRLLTALLTFVVKLIGSTWKFNWKAGQEHFEAYLSGDSPIIFCAWHNRMLGACYVYYSKWMRDGKRPLGALISQSKDGDFGACFGENLGGTIVRGSPNKGGMGSLKALFKLLSRDRISTVIFPDGSRGPKYRAKIGAVGLARMTGATLAPVSWESDQIWTLKSWDQYRIPKPFARINLYFGKPIQIDKSEKTEEALEARRLELENSLNAMQTEKPEPIVET